MAVGSPAQGQLRQGEREGVQPAVRHDQKRVSVAHPAGIPERKHHRQPPVHAERGHAQHGVTGGEGLRGAHSAAQRLPERLRARGHPEESGWHVDKGEEDVGQGQVEDEKTWHVGPELPTLGEAQ